MHRSIKAYLDWSRRLLLDPWLRYRPAITILRSSFPSSSIAIVDVGSGSFGLAHFLMEPIVGVDLEFSTVDREGFPPLLRPIRASATHLPFADGSFDAVVSVDMIEHLAPERRPRAIRELFRVARSLVVVGFPFGESSARFDREALAVEQQRGTRLAWREEHVRQGGVGDEVHREILLAATKTGRGMQVRWFGHEGLMGLRLRWKMQFLVAKDSRLYGALFAPLYWVHARTRPRHAYRRFYVASAHGTAAWRSNRSL